MHSRFLKRVIMDENAALGRRIPEGRKGLSLGYEWTPTKHEELWPICGDGEALT